MEEWRFFSWFSARRRKVSGFFLSDDMVHVSISKRTVCKNNGDLHSRLVHVNILFFSSEKLGAESISRLDTPGIFTGEQKTSPSFPVTDPLIAIPRSSYCDLCMAIGNQLSFSMEEPLD